MTKLTQVKGFSLVELIAILLLIAILGGAATSSLLPSTTFQLQASRDQIITAFFIAQQRAMVQTNPVRLVIRAPNQVDVREISGSVDASINTSAVRYPINLLDNQNLTPIAITFDRLGRPTNGGATLTLNQNSESLQITISATGFVF
ncbi:GspH/FimT family pseudopilin [Agarilytica rhodophyticola]|uniref:GspH/FimT family pseudopilin n=1 Tax=Agarilytica rhodophyticola TaxID=1737490 RepID=UPI000B34475B|nr:GspH/FimT family pseudopilin [Agarilytica rhodophyticola]